MDPTHTPTPDPSLLVHPHYCFHHQGAAILNGDCREALRSLPDESVHCVVTSPPYWGLRDYGLEGVVWGGDEECLHQWGKPILGKSQSGGLGGSKLQGAPPGLERRPEWSSAFCTHCNAWRGSLGLEPTPDLYVQHLVEVFREVRRVLRADGVMWLNLGDSYASTSSYNTTNSQHSANGWKQDGGYRPNAGVPLGLKPKDLCMIPARVALALQADGWYLRSDIIWSKPNPMPESVRDRPTRSHEHLFLLTRSGRYHYDWEAIAEPEVCGRKRGPAKHPSKDTNGNAGLGRREGTGTRNRRDVWTLPTRPYKGAHFATFPPDLVTPCLLAGCPPDGVALDPFAGSGTVGLVANSLSPPRRSILIEASADYCYLAAERLTAHLRHRRGRHRRGGGLPDPMPRRFHLTLDIRPPPGATLPVSPTGTRQQHGNDD